MTLIAADDEAGPIDGTNDASFPNLKRCNNWLSRGRTRISKIVLMDLLDALALDRIHCRQETSARGTGRASAGNESCCF